MEKWNDRTFTLLVRRGPEGFKLFLFSKKGPERTVEILIQFPFVDMRPLLRRYPICLCFFPLLLYIFLLLQFTCTHLSDEIGGVGTGSLLTHNIETIEKTSC